MSGLIDNALRKVFMAIIACPECGKKISSHAPICTHCGFQIGEVSEEQLEVFRGRKLRDKIYHLNAERLFPNSWEMN